MSPERRCPRQAPRLSTQCAPRRSTFTSSLPRGAAAPLVDDDPRGVPAGGGVAGQELARHVGAHGVRRHRLQEGRDHDLRRLALLGRLRAPLHVGVGLGAHLVAGGHDGAGVREPDAGRGGEQRQQRGRQADGTTRAHHTTTSRASAGTRGSGLCRSGRPARRGSVSRNWAPSPMRPQACSQPPWRWVSSSAIESPRPVPPLVRARAGSARQKRLKTMADSPGRSPTP